MLHSVGANAVHGLRRTNADKRRAVLALLNDEEWRQWSDREIARRCAASDRFVNSLRPSVSANDSQIDEPTPRLVTRNGTTYTQDTAKIGRATPQPVAEPIADASDTPPADVLPETGTPATIKRGALYCPTRNGMAVQVYPDVEI